MFALTRSLARGPIAIEAKSPLQDSAIQSGLSDADRLRNLMTVDVRCANPNRTVSVICAFCATMILSIGCPLAWEVSDQNPVAGFVIGIITLILCGWLIARKRRANLPNAAAVVLKARKFPILYLRPFNLDREPSPWYFALSQAGLLGAWTARSFLATPEARLIRSLSRQLRCPVVAVANPNSLKGHQGALRVWISHESWQEKVREFIRNAPIVLLAVGETEGSMWELEEVIRSLDPQRLALLVQRGDHARLIAALNRVLPKPIDELWHSTRFIAFEADWIPRQLYADDIPGRFQPVPRIES
jgi:hypothetical protein